jgi:NAD(P)H-hydrate epimerase
MPHPSSQHPDAGVRCGDPSTASRPRYLLDRASVRAVDHAAVEEYGMPSIVLMENAARALQAAARRMIDDAAAPRGPVLVVCGSGNNGGDGWALARHLHNDGVEVTIAPLGEPDAASDAGINCRICRAMGITEVRLDQLERQPEPAMIVDAIFGTGLARTVKGRAADVIEWINTQEKPVLAVDVPSGLDCDTGRPLGVAVKAALTVSFVGYKPGFYELPAQKHIGEIVIGDIGVPRELVVRFGRIADDAPPSSHRGPDD